MFSGKNASRALRRAAKANGLSRIDHWEAFEGVNILNEDELYTRRAAIPVAECYSKTGKKSVKVTAGDMYYFSAIMQDAPMARV